MRVIDLHCDTLLRCYEEKESLRANGGHIDIEKLKKGGALTQVFAIYLPAYEEALEEGLPADPRESFDNIYKMYRNELLANKDVLAEALSFEDINRNEKDGKISSILAVEDGELLHGQIEFLDELYAKGVRLLTLLWNNENCIGFSHSGDAVEMALGLKPFGIEVVERMNELGIAVDVSHLSAGGFEDVARYSKKPFIASHSCAKSLCGHSRNLSDDQLKIIAEKGGLVGVNFKSDFLREGSEYSKIKEIVEHMAYIKNVAGIEAVAIGSDFDGIDCEIEIKDYSYIPLLIDEMSKVFNAAEMEKICSENALRFFKDTLF